jgi:hypothetical protein
MYIGIHSSQVLMKRVYRLIFENYSNITFYENLSSGIRLVPYGWTDITKSLFDILGEPLKCVKLLRTSPNKARKSSPSLNNKRDGLD